MMECRVCHINQSFSCFATKVFKSVQTFCGIGCEYFIPQKNFVIKTTECCPDVNER